MNSANNDNRRKNIYMMLPALICLIIAIGQYYFRSLDDNHIASWYFLFTSVSLTKLILILAPSLLLAVFASQFSLPAPTRVFFLFCACFVSAAALWNIPEINVDASRYFTEAKHLELYGIKYFLKEWGAGFPVFSDLPAVPFLDGLIFRVFGETRLYIQIFNTILLSLTGVLTCFIGKELWDEETGFYAGMFLLGMPHLFIMTPLMLVDIPLMFFLTLSIYLFMRAFDTGGMWRIGAAAAAVFVTVYTKFTAVALLSILPLITIMYSVKNEGPKRRQVLRRSMGVFLISFLLIVATAAFKWNVFLDQVKMLSVMQKNIRDTWSESYLSTFLFQINPVVTLSAVVSFWVAVRKRDLKYVLVIWLPFLIILFQINRVRYEMPAFPMLALMASYGINVFRDRTFKKAIVAATVAASLVTCFFLYPPYVGQLKVNLKQAGEFLDTLDIDQVEVFISPQRDYPLDPAIAVPMLDIFTHKQIIYRYVPIHGTTQRFFFSWDYRNPVYYDPGANDGPRKKAIALIVGSSQDGPTPEIAGAVSGLQHSEFFAIRSRGYSFQTLVRIYW